MGAVLHRQDDADAEAQSVSLRAKRRLGTVAQRLLFCLMANPSHLSAFAIPGVQAVAEAPLVRLLQLLLLLLLLPARDLHAAIPGPWSRLEALTS